MRHKKVKDKPIIVIGDVHGCYDTLMALVVQLPKDAVLVFCGDLIDRGPKSKEVIDFVRNNGHLCVKGNHEDMLLDIVNGVPGSGIWHNEGNGGIQTLQSFNRKEAADISPKYIKWLNELPYYIHFPYNKRESDGRSLLVTHTSLTKSLKNAVKELKDNKFFQCQFTWGRRPPMNTINKDVYQVFGHTPMAMPLIEPHYANIDTGACFGYKLTALEWPSMKIYSQLFIDKKDNK